MAVLLSPQHYRQLPKQSSDLCKSPRGGFVVDGCGCGGCLLGAGLMIGVAVDKLRFKVSR